MIDFRYHLVSLISVFLALAVGIALGAGPLKESIGDTLTGQVDQLRAEKDALRADLDAAQAGTAASDAIISAAAPELLDGTLAGRRVAVVALGTVDADAQTAIEERLAEAGASISARVTLTDAWSSTDTRSFRQALVGNLVDYLDPQPASDATVDTSVAEALVQGLVGADPASPDRLSSSASTLLELLTTGDDPLVAVTDEVTAPADAVVLLAPTVATPADPKKVDADQLEATVQSQVALTRVAQQRSEGAVLVDGPTAEGTVVAAVLADDGAADAVTTVTGGDTVGGQVTVPLALNARIGGTNGHYGVGEGLTVLPTAVQLPAPVRAPAPETADAGAQG